ncbi:MAG: phosphatidylserine/phosphatidylglycerophosphate/cardiolipin synthase family protein [Bdellovibrionales bacterium]|nr:phosphatidylserine/phosphatidylglycerophosphate/cardiolipin synthase family protein [Bdellovibrionales bacterium]
MSEARKTWLQQKSSELGGLYSVGNDIEILVDASQFIPSMLSMIESAKHQVAYQFFGIESDPGGLPFAKALTESAKKNIDVHVIMDWLEMKLQTNGKWTFLPFQSKEIAKERKDTWDLVDSLENHGIDVLKYSWKYLWHRNHSKSLIIDQSQCCIGGFNPTEHNMRWHEVCAKVQGPLAKDAAKHFNELFHLEKRPGLSDLSFSANPSFSGSKLCEASLFYTRPKEKKFGLTQMVFDLIDHATDSIWIENGYIAYAKILQKLCEAKKRGVKDIRIIAPIQSNHSSVDRRFKKWIPTLKKHDIQVYYYPEMTHAKVMMVDQKYVSIGSLNFEELSFLLNNELNIIGCDEQGYLVEQTREKIFFPDFAKSTLA